MPVWGYVVWLAQRANHERRQQVVLQVVASLAVFSLLVSGQFVFQYAYYGEWTPNTYVLKLTGMALPDRLRNGAGFLIPFFRETTSILILAGIGLRAKWNARALLLSSVAATALSYQLYVGGDPWAYWRIMAPTMRPYLVANSVENVNTALALNQLTTADATLAVLFAGTLPYYADRKAVDLLGKSDPYIARRPPDLSGRISWAGMTSVPGHNKYDRHYSIESLEPTYAQVVSWGSDDLTEWAASQYATVDFRGVRLLLRRGSNAVIWSSVQNP